MPETFTVMIFIKGLDVGGLSGGADLFGLNLACALKEQGVQVVLCICFKIDTEAAESYLNLIRGKGVNPVFLQDWVGHTSVNGYLGALRRLRQNVKSLQVDIIHSHFHTGTLMAVVLKVFRQVRYVVRTAHVDEEWTRGWQGIIQQFIIRMLIFVIFPLFVNLEAGVSGYSVEVLNKRLLARLLGKRAVVVNNAIPVPFQSTEMVKNKVFDGWQSGHPIIGSIGRLEEQKGYQYFINALPDILLDYPEADIWIIGDGQLRAELVKQCEKLGIQNKVFFWGKRSDVPELLTKMDLFVSSSVYEGLPTVVLEAIAYGIPCVVTDIPGTKDIVHNEINGLCVPPRDSEALSNTIKTALGDPALRKRLVENGLRTVEAFRIENISHVYTDAYRRL